MNKEIKEASKDVIEVGQNIQKQREFQGMSQEALALEIGTNGAAVSKYETGQREMKLDKLFQIADALHVTPTELCPKRFDQQEKIDPRVFQLGEQLKKLSPEKQDAALQAMTALLMGFQAM